MVAADLKPVYQAATETEALQALEEFQLKWEKRYPARRWVVERMLGWLSKCRAILVRYEKKAANYLGLVKVACILLWYRRQHRLSLSR